jgi:hypothetical protein
MTDARLLGEPFVQANIRGIGTQQQVGQRGTVQHLLPGIPVVELRISMWVPLPGPAVHMLVRQGL